MVSRFDSFDESQISVKVWSRKTIELNAPLTEKRERTTWFHQILFKAVINGNIFFRGGHSFLNSFNSLNCSWISLILELFLKNTTFWLLFLKCSWEVIFDSDAHKVIVLYNCHHLIRSYNCHHLIRSYNCHHLIRSYNCHHLIRSPTFEYLTIFGWNF